MLTGWSASRAKNHVVLCRSVLHQKLRSSRCGRLILQSQSPWVTGRGLWTALFPSFSMHLLDPLLGVQRLLSFGSRSEPQPWSELFRPRLFQARRRNGLSCKTVMEKSCTLTIWLLKYGFSLTLRWPYTPLDNRKSESPEFGRTIQGNASETSDACRSDSSHSKSSPSPV